jgi:hypothetical protein
MSFLNWLEESPHRSRTYENKVDKENIVEIVSTFFPECDIKTEIRELEYIHCKKLYIQSKFSGRHIMDKYGLKGVEIGNALNKFKKQFTTKKEYDDFILDHDVEMIMIMFERICIEDHSIS